MRQATVSPATVTLTRPVVRSADGRTTPSKILIPEDLGGTDRAALTSCIEAYLESVQACTACADACSEDSVQQLTACVRTNLDCADVCSATGQVLSRHTAFDAT